MDAIVGVCIVRDKRGKRTDPSNTFIPITTTKLVVLLLDSRTTRSYIIIIGTLLVV